MGWFKESLDKLAASIAGSPPLELTFAPSVSATDISGIGEPIEPDSCYIELYLEFVCFAITRRGGARSSCCNLETRKTCGTR